nr:MAG TPA: Type III secretion system translocator protein, HrpF [Caudoviricetes sp.]
MKVDYESMKEFFITEFNFHSKEMQYPLFVGFTKSIFENSRYSDAQKAKVMRELLAAFEKVSKE